MMAWLEITDLYPSTLAALATVLCVSESWAMRIQVRRLGELPAGDLLHRQLVSFLADFHLALATAAGLLAMLCIVLIIVPENTHMRYPLWSAWVLAWLLFSFRRWCWLFLGSRVPS